MFDPTLAKKTCDQLTEWGNQGPDNKNGGLIWFGMKFPWKGMTRVEFNISKCQTVPG